MATKKFYIGSHGPYYYEDDELIDDPDGDFAGQFRAALVAEGISIPGLPVGASGDVTVLTAFQAGGGGPEGVQYKTRLLTIDDGLITVIGAESAWVDV